MLSSNSYLSILLKQSIFLLASLVLLVGVPLKSLYAAEPFVVKDIRVEGLQRVEPGTVFSYLPVQVGERFTSEKAADSIKALYATGFFRDVQIQAQGDVLIVIVEERPTISRIEFTGMKEFDPEVVRKSLRTVGVADARFYDKALIDKAEQELKRQYVSKGLFAAEVVTTVTPGARNQVAIFFNIDEGPSAKIKDINFIGNKAFSESTLRGEMQLQTGGWLSWYSKDNLYSKQKLTADLEAIRSYYLNRGYLEFVIESTQVSITPDKKDIYLTISIREENKFTVKNISLAGDLFDKEKEFQSLLQIKPGDTFSSAKLANSTKAIAEKLGSYGYAFAVINPQPDIRRDLNEVDITLVVDAGRRTYVRNIEITGNAKTRDLVIRREMRQFESSWFDSEKIRISKERINRTGFFKDVTLDTTDVPGSSDQVDILVKVEEQPTGAFSLGAGFSSNAKLTLTTGVNQQNAFGTGTDIGLNFMMSSISPTYVLTQYDPYFLENGISRYSDLFYRSNKPLYFTGDKEYKIKSVGTTLKIGVPYTEVDRVFYGSAIEFSEYTVTLDSPVPYQDYVRSWGKRIPGTLQTYNIPITLGWASDTRDSALIPSKGSIRRFTGEVGTPLGNLMFYQLFAQYQKYHSFSKGTVLSFNGEVGYGKSYTDKGFPINKNYFVGGIGTVRGYMPGSLGPKYVNTSTGAFLPVGGSSKIVTNIEYTFPAPGTGVDKTFRLFTFVDGGNAFDEFRLSLRYSYGLGLSWISPLGPLKFSFGIPVKRQPTDNLQKMQFQIGTGF